MFKTHTFTSLQQGPHLLFLGGIHGNETAGTKAQQQIIQQIEEGNIILKKGIVTFVPCANVKAQEQDIRFVDINLNRVIKYHSDPQNNEEKIANQLIKLINDCDIMLDIHSTHCKNDVEFAFIDYPSPSNLELLSIMPVKNALSGWPDIYNKEQDISDFSTERYAYEQGKTGITIECGYHKAQKSVSIATTAILNVMSFYGMINKEKPQIQQKKTIKLSSFIIKNREGKLSKDYQHLTPINKDEILAIYSDGEKITAPFNGYIIMPNHEAVIGSEWFYLGY